jgi:hypothetical protein
MSMKLAARSAFTMVLVGIGFVVTTPARADVQVGILSCRSLGSATYIIVSDRPFNCMFTPSAGGPLQYYQANIHRVGAQAGFNSNVALEWAVFAPGPGVGPGALAGVYGGVSAGAAIGVGVGANGLVGGSNSFALQSEASRVSLVSLWLPPQPSLTFSQRCGCVTTLGDAAPVAVGSDRGACELQV